MDQIYESLTFANLRRFMMADERKPEYEEIRRPTPLLAWTHMSINWASILGCWALLASGAPVWFLPLALVIVGSRQRALNNIIHDASHNNLFRTRRWNSIFSTVFSALPLGESHELYRTRHMMHHAHLGNAQRDPDYQTPPRVGPGSPVRRAWQFYRHFLLDWNQWRSSLTGAWQHLDARQRAAVAMWWSVVLVVMVLTVGIPATLAFYGLWMASRATTYHLFRIFAEISDHTGLGPGSIEQYTRNMPTTHWSPLLHPFNDNYHLTHHLFPNVPMIRLRHLHKLLLKMPAYARCQCIDGYFTGAFPLIRSWTDSLPDGR